MKNKKWQFWIDRGGTFTDIVARTPDRSFKTHKLLSENPEQYEDAAIEGISILMGNLDINKIEHVKMGTTVGTNALLEHKGEKTLLIITKGFKDQIRIGYQARPKIFARHITLPQMLYSDVIEAEERYSATGEELQPLNQEQLKSDLQTAYNNGHRCCAIIFMHGYKYKLHEEKAEKIAKAIGFTQISVSSKVAPLIKLVSRGDTTIVDAYLSPILRRYVEQVASRLGDTKLMFMRSSGGLTDAKLFAGKDCILSGPAGGIVGAAETAKQAGFDKIIGFDMGGTSTDVAHFRGEYERRFDTIIAGARIRAPMMDIHTVAAGGGSICYFDGMRYRVGPESAGANPGPAGYRRGGDLTVTDCNIMLGKLRPEFFPNIFGEHANEPLDRDIVISKFETMAKEIGDNSKPEAVAEGFLNIAVLSMADAIKKISIQRGYDVTEYTLTCFGGAGGQHACLVADVLGITSIFLHPFAGVLSAYGMGLAPTTATREKSFEAELNEENVKKAKDYLQELIKETTAEMQKQGLDEQELTHHKQLHVRYVGTDTSEIIAFGNQAEIVKYFEEKYLTHYGFLMPDTDLIIETIAVETIAQTHKVDDTYIPVTYDKSKEPIDNVNVYMNGKLYDTPVYDRDSLQTDYKIIGPAIIKESTGTTILEPDWSAIQDIKGNLILNKKANSNVKETNQSHEKADPVMLEIFNNLFMSIAEQMGTVLENTAYSVNIKERLDFSCAVFDAKGGLIANAPHMPVHLGSMGDSVRAIMENRKGKMHAGDTYMLNNPYHGGTHLPDITVVTPVFGKLDDVLFYVASRGHHSDIGGITPGSMPAHSTHIDEEGILLTDVQIVKNGVFQDKYIADILSTTENPARNIDQNLKDLRAQVAANAKGITELENIVKHFGLNTVTSYMDFIQDNAEESVRQAIHKLKDGEFNLPMDNGANIKLKITINNEARSAIIDFTGTSSQMNNSNFNAPLSVCRASVLYVFRTLVDDDIPMNEGCLKPIELIVPEGSILNPKYPAAVVAGNVETSQCVTNALYGALNVMAAAQGTMNNFTFGNENHQYYETICGGSGAGNGFNGTSAVQTHMTNSRLTDPEILEHRFPVRLEEFSIRKNSGGKGQYNGGDGVIRRIRFLEDMTISLLANNYINPPFGLNGGGNAKTGNCQIEKKNGEVITLNSTDQKNVQKDDVIIIYTSGGGGFNNKN